MTRASRQGFTLIEMLVVLVIVGLATTAIPRLWGAGSGGLVRAAADAIGASLRAARSEARATARDVRVWFDTGQGTYRQDGGAIGRIPAGATLQVEATAAETAAAGRIAIRFDAEGGSTGGRVRVAYGTALAAVEVDWLTGHVAAAR